MSPPEGWRCWTGFRGHPKKHQMWCPGAPGPPLAGPGGSCQHCYCVSKALEKAPQLCASTCCCILPTSKPCADSQPTSLVSPACILLPRTLLITASTGYQPLPVQCTNRAACCGKAITLTIMVLLAPACSTHWLLQPAFRLQPAWLPQQCCQWVAEPAATKPARWRALAALPQQAAVSIHTSIGQRPLLLELLPLVSLWSQPLINLTPAVPWPGTLPHSSSSTFCCSEQQPSSLIYGSSTCCTNR